MIIAGRRGRRRRWGGSDSGRWRAGRRCRICRGRRWRCGNGWRGIDRWREAGHWRSDSSRRRKRSSRISWRSRRGCRRGAGNCARRVGIERTRGVGRWRWIAQSYAGSGKWRRDSGVGRWSWRTIRRGFAQRARGRRRSGGRLSSGETDHARNAAGLLGCLDTGEFDLWSAGRLIGRGSARRRRHVAFAGQRRINSIRDRRQYGDNQQRLNELHVCPP